MTNAFIYLDFRECGFAKGSQEKIDTWFKYDAEKKKYYWNDLLRNNQWVQTDTGDIIRIWEIKNTVPKTDCLPNFWRNNLSVQSSPSQFLSGTSSLSSLNLHPFNHPSIEPQINRDYFTDCNLNFSVLICG